MRICHGLTGCTVEVEDQVLEYRKPFDVVQQKAIDQWDVDTNDLIVLVGGGGVLGPGCSAEVLADGRDVFLFLRSALDPNAELVPQQLVADFVSGGVQDAGNDRNTAVDGPERNAYLQDPAFETFRGNITEARRHIADARPVVSLALRAESRLAVQRLAAQSVLENLANQRTTCSRSMALLLQKYERVQERFDQNLGQVDASIAALSGVSLHPAFRADGRETLADVVPQDRIMRFTTTMQEERTRLAQRLEKLQQEDSNVQLLCEQVSKNVRQFLEEQSVGTAAQTIQCEHNRAESDLLPALRGLVPREGAPPSSVLEEEKRSAGMLEDVAKVCSDVRDMLSELQICWERQQVTFLQRLREVSYTQSKVRGVERQAALLEEEINVQRNYSQQLSHLQKMPKAYQKALGEVARRRQFRSRYAAQCEQARSTLAKMMEEENSRRRNFVTRYGCHLPSNLFDSLSSLAPPATVDLPDFDAALPDVELASLQEESLDGVFADVVAGNEPEAGGGAASSVLVGGGAASGSQRVALAQKSGVSAGRERCSSNTSSCSSSLRTSWVAAEGPTSARGVGSGSGGSSGRTDRGSSGGSGGQMAASSKAASRVTLGSAPPVQTSMQGEDRNDGAGGGGATDLALNTASAGVAGADSSSGAEAAARRRIAELEAKCKNLEAQVRSIEQQGRSAQVPSATQ